MRGGGKLALAVACLVVIYPALLGAPALAEVSVNPRALDALAEPDLPLPPPPPPGAPPAEAPARIPPAARATPPAPAPSAKPELPSIGTGPPAPELPPPPIVVPTRPPPPPAPLRVTDDAVGNTSPLANGLRVSFGPAAADLNPAGEAALRKLVQDAPDGTRFEIDAYAAGAPDDPSTPRRLALARALAVRGVLVAAGVPSTHILVRSLGPDPTAAKSGLPADRADVTLSPAAHK